MNNLNNNATYRSWSAMKRRCQNPNCWNYKWYGGRGITVCVRWQTFRNFLADMGEKPESCTLDRIDHEGNYEPSNCRWATQKEQTNNMRTNRLVELNGLTLTVAQWADRLGIPPDRIRARLNLGMKPNRALSTSIGLTATGERAVFYYGSLALTLKDWSKLLGIEYGTLWARIHRSHMPFLIALSYDASGLRRR